MLIPAGKPESWLYWRKDRDHIYMGFFYDDYYVQWLRKSSVFAPVYGYISKTVELEIKLPYITNILQIGSPWTRIKHTTFDDFERLF